MTRQYEIIENTVISDAAGKVSLPVRVTFTIDLTDPDDLWPDNISFAVEWNGKFHDPGDVLHDVLISLFVDRDHSWLVEAAKDLETIG